MMKIKRCFIVVLITLSMLVGTVITSTAGEVDVIVDFAYNGTPDMETLGFKFYKEGPDGIEVVVADIVGPEKRTWRGTVKVDEGKSSFSLSAYSATAESGKSPAVPFEYIEPITPGGLPTPTVIIKFN